MQKEKIAFEDIKKTFSWYRKLTKQHDKVFWCLFLAYSIGTIFAEIISVVLYKEIIDALSASEKNIEHIAQLCFWLFITYLIFYIAFRIGERYNRLYQVSSLESLSRFTFSKIQDHSYSFFSNRFAGSLTSQANKFIDGFTNVSETLLFTYWLHFLQLVGIIAVIAFYAWQVSLILVISMILITITVIPLVRRKMEYDAKEAEEDTKVSGYFSDVVSNILSTKIFSSRKFEELAYKEKIEAQMTAYDNSFRAWNLLAAIQNGLVTGLRLALLFIGIYLWSLGSITAGTVVLIFSYSQMLFSMAWQLVRSSSYMLRTFANAKELVEIFELPPEIEDISNAKTLEVQKGEISFKEVSFMYSDNETIFKNLSFSITPGEHVGLVGPSGGGKTTITKLLLRFADPDEGHICVDGINIREVTQDSLRANIAYVPQDPTLFHRSLFENIAYARQNATQEEVIQAAKRAHAHEFIEKLGKGYGTKVGERGIKLSGGQRQRVAIARAILKNAPILVMDEATSSLDTVSERAIRDSLDEMMKGKTVLIIAHRLSTVEKLDRILVLDKSGKIVEEGNHQALLKKGGLYAKLWHHQVGGFLAEEG